MVRVLLVDEDSRSRERLHEWVRDRGCRVDTASTLREARSALKKREPDLLLLNDDLSEGNGLDLLDELSDGSRTDVVIVTGSATVDDAVEAMREGVLDYLVRPVDFSRLERILGNVRRTHALKQEVQSLRGELRSLGRFGNLIGSSPPMQKVYDQISQVATTDATVFLTGETGTGKEVVARAIHENSARSGKPLVPLNCGAVSPSLIESELFGHEKGSFTGAVKTHQGIFERADGGTLFLDEITEMPSELQVKLLRVLETQNVTRIGGTRVRSVDVRLITATNRDPQEAVKAGKLREDLLYRLLVFPIHLPPIRERTDDLEMLARHFLAELNEQTGSSKRFTPGALEQLAGYDWPGNVRELKNVIERSYVASGEVIETLLLPRDRRRRSPTSGPGRGTLSLEIGIPIAEAERRLILATLEACDGDKKKAAAKLGISLKTLYNRLKKYREKSNAPDRS